MSTYVDILHHCQDRMRHYSLCIVIHQSYIFYSRHRHSLKEALFVFTKNILDAIYRQVQQNITMYTLVKLTCTHISSSVKVGAISALCTGGAGACLTASSILITT